MATVTQALETMTGIKGSAPSAAEALAWADTFLAHYRPDLDPAGTTNEQKATVYINALRRFHKTIAAAVAAEEERQAIAAAAEARVAAELGAIEIEP